MILQSKRESDLTVSVRANDTNVWRDLCFYFINDIKVSDEKSVFTFLPVKL